MTESIDLDMAPFILALRELFRLGRQTPETPPHYEEWAGQNCASLRRTAVRLRAGVIQPDDPSMTGDELAAILDRIVEYQLQSRELAPRIRRNREEIFAIVDAEEAREKERNLETLLRAKQSAEKGKPDSERRLKARKKYLLLDLDLRREKERKRKHGKP